MSTTSSAWIQGSGKTPLFSDQQIEQVTAGPSVCIAKWVRSTASERGISFRRMPADRFARAASRLSDAEADLDQVEELLVALRRAGVISTFQRGLLQVHYLR
jgi:hypothetical protein